jgi:hypothetical protein
MNVPRHVVTMAITLAAIVVFVPPVAAQSSKPPRDPAAIQRKVQRSAELQRQALEALGNPAQALRLVRNAWTQLKAAQDDMVMNYTNMKPPDPMLNLGIRKTEQALPLIQVAGDTLQNRDESGVEVARDRLQQALRITNSLLATAF